MYQQNQHSSRHQVTYIHLLHADFCLARQTRQALMQDNSTTTRYHAQCGFCSQKVTFYRSKDLARMEAGAFRFHFVDYHQTDFPAL